MEILKSILVCGKIAELILTQDALKVVWDGNTLTTLKRGAWRNLQDDDWAQESLIAVEVSSYLTKKESAQRVQALADMYF